MVQKHFCDRCDRELVLKKDDPFETLDLDSEFSSFGKFNNLNRIIKPHLCAECSEGYNKIIGETNKTVSNFLSEKPKEEQIEKPKKKKWFKKE